MWYIDESTSVPIYGYTSAGRAPIKPNADKCVIGEQLCTVSHTFSLHRNAKCINDFL
jgi:hypothetical protein